MYDHLVSMDNATHAGYLDRIRCFFESSQSYPFATECFISTLTQVITHDVQQQRGEVSQLLVEAQAHGLSADNVTLVQNLTTMKIEFEDAPSLLTLKLNSKAMRSDSFKQGRHNLIVCLGYGDNLPVYLRSRALWEFFISHYPNIQVIFTRDTDKLGRGEVQHNGHDLLFGVGLDPLIGTTEQPGYAATGIWSQNENRRQIYRQIALYDYLLRTRSQPFYVYQATITSVVDFRGLFAVLDQMPATGCYAGMPGRVATPSEYADLTFACGTNSLFSSDLVTLMRDRYDPNHPYATLPNDIWQALILHDIPRIPLLFSASSSRASLVPITTR